MGQPAAWMMENNNDLRVEKTALTLACDREIGKARKFMNNRSRPAEAQSRVRDAIVDLYPQILWIRMCIAGRQHA
jgi:hypothetical protein